MTANSTTWHFINIASGPSAVETPYKVAKKNNKFVRSQPPLREGSYRALASTANNFARESFMDELAAAASIDPLEFRLDNLENPRLRAVLEEAAKRFGWSKKVGEKQPNRGIGLACGTEKGSFVAACVEIAIDPDSKEIKVCVLARLSSVARFSTRRTFATRSRARSQWALARRCARRWSLTATA